MARALGTGPSDGPVGSLTDPSNAGVHLVNEEAGLGRVMNQDAQIARVLY